MRFLVMTANEADTLRAITGEHVIAPRLIDGGAHAGSYAVPARVLTDPNHADKLNLLQVLPEYEIDIEAAWPTVE